MNTTITQGGRGLADSHKFAKF